MFKHGSGALRRRRLRIDGRSDTYSSRGRSYGPQETPGKISVALELSPSRIEGVGEERGIDSGDDERAKVEVGPSDARGDDALTDERRTKCTDGWSRQGDVRMVRGSSG